MDRDKCECCLVCAKVCPTGAIRASGRRLSVDTALAEILKDKVFYNHSGGGVTFSGGEPLLQHVPLGSILERCRVHGISSCADTSLAVPWTNIEHVLDKVDLFLVDVKHADSEDVRAREVLDNLKRLVGRARVWVRIPVIPNWNAAREEMNRIADALDPLRGGIEKICLLPFHNTAEMRYRYLNRDWGAYMALPAVPDADLDSYMRLFAARGHSARIGG